MLRSFKERVLQTLSFELSELMITVPIFAGFTQTSQSDSLIVLVAIGAATMCWTGIHNTIFDWLELRLSQRVASDRRGKMRVIHAISLATSAILVSVPILVTLGGLSFWQAIVADLGLTVLDAAYALIFFRIYDIVRPVAPTQPTNFQGV